MLARYCASVSRRMASGPPTTAGVRVGAAVGAALAVAVGARSRRHVGRRRLAVAVVAGRRGRRVASGSPSASPSRRRRRRSPPSSAAQPAEQRSEGAARASAQRAVETRSAHRRPHRHPRSARDERRHGARSGSRSTATCSARSPASKSPSAWLRQRGVEARCRCSRGRWRRPARPCGRRCRRTPSSGWKPNNSPRRCRRAGCARRMCASWNVRSPATIWMLIGTRTSIGPAVRTPSTICPAADLAAVARVRVRAQGAEGQHAAVGADRRRVEAAEHLHPHVVVRLPDRRCRAPRRGWSSSRRAPPGRRRRRRSRRAGSRACSRRRARLEVEAGLAERAGEVVVRARTPSSAARDVSRRGPMPSTVPAASNVLKSRIRARLRMVAVVGQRRQPVRLPFDRTEVEAARAGAGGEGRRHRGEGRRRRSRARPPAAR